MTSILIIHGPNLNLLGVREPHIYGAETLDDINAHLVAVGSELGVQVRHIQSNHEGALIDALQAERGHIDAVVINPAAFTHTSVALRDALKSVDVPFVEVHLSNVHQREAFRHHSYFSDVAQAVVCGLGAYGYEVALRYLCAKIA